MYIQITTRCNMSCAHCCMSATACGEDMSLEVFRAALNYDPDYPAIGGGEPTLHPQFNTFLLEAIAEAEHVWLATNGSVTKTAIMLAKLARAGVIGCALSLDEWHDPIDPEVEWAFDRGCNPTSDDCREIRSNDRDSVLNIGRCDFGKPGCACSELQCAPDGTVRGCGCADAPVFGNILDPDFAIPDEWEFGECSHDQPEAATT